jgi:predicted PurR-regulated permease PerM
MGVLGIAFIQAFAGGLGMVIIGIPGAGLWALFILVLAIAQLPPLLVLLPAIIYVFSTNDNTTAAVIFTVWSLIVSFSDTFLKPMLLGRGVNVPMLVILLGAIGGMISAGIVGLFVGAVVLALGYTLFQDWLNVDEEPTEDPEQHGETA